MNRPNSSYKDFLVGRKDELIAMSLLADHPVWRPLSTRALADCLGVSVQSLANWRVRGNGPPSTLIRRGQRRAYRLDEVLEWVSGIPYWKICRSWMAARGMVPPDASQDDIEWVISVLG